MQLKNGFLDLPKDKYHEDTTHISHSSLECFRESVPLYHGRYVTKTIPPRKDTDAFAFGTAFHTILLEPEKFEKEFVVAPRKFDLRKTDDKKAKEELISVNPGKAIISKEDYDELHLMADSVFSNSEAERYILKTPGEAEMALQWQCPDTGIWCKLRADKLCRSEGEGIIVDIKTTRDPTPRAFAKAVANYGYHRSSVWYRWGASHSINLDARFIIIAVGTEPPYEAICYEIDEAATALAWDQITADLRTLRDCRLFDQWGSRWTGETRKISLPLYAFNE